MQSMWNAILHETGVTYGGKCQPEFTMRENVQALRSLGENVRLGKMRDHGNRSGFKCPYLQQSDHVSKVILVHLIATNFVIYFTLDLGNISINNSKITQNPFMTRYGKRSMNVYIWRVYTCCSIQLEWTRHDMHSLFVVHIFRNMYKTADSHLWLYKSTNNFWLILSNTKTMRWINDRHLEYSMFCRETRK